MKEINCPNCNQHIKILGTDYDLYLEKMKEKDKKIERLNNIKNDYEQRINDVLLYIECCDVFYDTKKIARILNGKEKLKKKYLTRK